VKASRFSPKAVSEPVLTAITTAHAGSETGPVDQASVQDWRRDRSRAKAQVYDPGMRALIVEDDATIADLVARGPRESGFAIDLAADGETALERTRQQSYDVAIVDLMLPRRDGHNVFVTVRPNA
jgi:PleD family two-component response regulator